MLDKRKGYIANEKQKCISSDIKIKILKGIDLYLNKLTILHFEVVQLVLFYIYI